MVDVHVLLAVLACTLFTGAALYITFVEHPARISCGTELAAREFGPSYRRATIMQASLAVIAGLAGLILWLHRREPLWLWGALAILAVVPFTLVAIRPTNNRLLEPGRDLASAETHELLLRWGRLHAVRSLLGLIASVLYLSAGIP